MALGQILIKSFFTICLNYGTILVGLVVIMIFCIDFYDHNVKVNEDTDNVDLMQRYMWLQMHRRYRANL